MVEKENKQFGKAIQSIKASAKVNREKSSRQANVKHDSVLHIREFSAFLFYFPNDMRVEGGER